MLIRRHAALLAIAVACFVAEPAQARRWSDTTGKFSIEAELIAADEMRAVLQTKAHKLLSADLKELSTPDRVFVDEWLKKSAESESPDVNQTWTLQSGLKVRARVVGFGEREMTLMSRKGIYVNDRRFDNLPEVYKKMVPMVVAHFESIQFKTQPEFKAWASKNAKKMRRYSLQGVILELENGDRYSVPFFFFTQNDVKMLEPGWQRWVAAEADSAAREREDMLAQAQAQAYQQDQEANDQVAQLKLAMLGTIAGVTSIWEVELYPAQGTWGQPMSVIVPARDSREATVKALGEYPGYVAGPVRKASY